MTNLNKKPSSKKKRAPKKVRLDKPFAGIPAGAMLFVATPEIVEQYIRRIPHGQTRTIERMRRELARRRRCDAACPVSTAIFLKMVAEAAWSKVQEGQSLAAVAPFWRLVDPESSFAKKLSVDARWLAQQRELEGVARRTSSA